MKKENLNPLVTIVCIVYNHEKYLRKTLDGFVMQKTNFLYEVLIHDDASTDGSAKIIKEYQKKYPNIIRPILQKENQYSKGIRITNSLYPKVKGQYIALCEGDDFWTDDHKLATQIDYMQHHPECSCTVHPVNWLVDSTIERNDSHGNQEQDFSVEQIIRGGGMFVATCSLCFRSEFVKRDLPKFFAMADIGDYPLQIYLAICGTVHYFPRIMACYRWKHEGSWSARMAHNKDKIVKHVDIELKWLTEVDNYTQKKYTKAITYHKTEMALGLYLNKEFSQERWDRLFERLSNEDKKHFKKIIFKYRIKQNLKYFSPQLYSCLRWIKRSVR